MLPFAAQEDPLPGHEHVFEYAHRRGLPVTTAEQGLVHAGATSWAGDDGEPGGVDRYRAGDGEGLIRGVHRAARQDQEFVDVGCGSDDGLDPRDHDAAGSRLDPVHVGVGMGLLVRAQTAIALGIGHGNADGEVARLDVGQISGQALLVVRAVLGIETVGQLPGGVEPVHTE